MAYTIKIETNDAVKSLEALKKQVAELKSNLEHMDKSTASYKKALNELAKAEKQLGNAQKASASSMSDFSNAAKSSAKTVNQAAKSTQKATDNFKAMRDEIRQLRSNLYGTTEGTAEYNEALTKLANKMRDFNDMNQAVRASAKDLGQMIGNSIGTMNGFVGAFAAVSGSLELFGSNAEWVQKLETKSLSLIKILQGLSAIEDGFTKKWPQLKAQLQALNAQWADSIKQKQLAKTVTETLTTAETANATAKTISTAETTAFNTATDAGAASQVAFAGTLASTSSALNSYGSNVNKTMKILENLRKEEQSLLNSIQSYQAEYTRMSMAPSFYNQEDIDKVQEKIDMARLKLRGTQADIKRTSEAYNITAAGVTAANSKIGFSFKKLSATIKTAFATNPLGAILTAISAIIALFPLVIKGFKKMSDSMASTGRDAENLKKHMDSLFQVNEYTIKLKMKYDGWSEFDAQMERVRALEKKIDYFQQTINEKKEELAGLTVSTTLAGYYSETEKKISALHAQIKVLTDEVSESEAKLAVAKSLASKLQTEETLGRWKEDAKEREDIVNKILEEGRSEAERINIEYDKRAEAIRIAYENGELKSLQEYNNLIVENTRQRNEKLASLNKKYETTTENKSVNVVSEDLQEAQSKLNTLLNNLQNWRQKFVEDQKTLHQRIVDNYNDELQVLEESHKKQLLSEEKFYEAKAELNAKFAEDLRKALFEQTQSSVAALQDSYQKAQLLIESDYNVKINDADLHSNRVKAIELTIEMENKLFNAEKTLLENEIALWQEFADKQKEGSQEQIEALQNVAKVQNELIIATNTHTIAQKSNNVAKDEAATASRSLTDALREYLNMDTKAANMLEHSLNAASEVTSEISNLISLYADEAQARSENEELTAEQREKAFQQYKNLQMAQATISYLEGVVQAWSTAMTMPKVLVVPTGIALTSLLTAQYAKQMSSIKSTTMDNNTTGSTGTSVSTTNIAAPKYTTAEANIEAARPLSDTRVYVLESDISAVQNKNLTRVKDTTF